MSGFISPKRAVILRLDSRIFSGLLDGILGGLMGVLLSLCPWALKSFAAKRKMAEPIFKAQPSLFFPQFDFTLMNVYMNTGIM